MMQALLLCVLLACALSCSYGACARSAAIEPKRPSPRASLKPRPAPRQSPRPKPSPHPSARPSPRPSPRPNSSPSPRPSPRPKPSPAPALNQPCVSTPFDVLGPYYQSRGVPQYGPGPVSGFCIPDTTAPATNITISGGVYGVPSCARPLNGTAKSVTVEVWQATNVGEYDNNQNITDYNCRATIHVGASGTYSFTTVHPASYGSPNCLRPAHIHFRVSALGYRQVTTQMYFKGDPLLWPNDCGCANQCNSSASVLQVRLNNRNQGVFNIILGL